MQVHEYVKACHKFRDPVTGVAHPRLTNLLNMINLTAEKRVRAVFYWAHVLGPDAKVVVPTMRRTALIAVSTLQLLLISTRGHRSYSRKELDTIYLDVGHQFFTSLETLAAFVDNNRIVSGTQTHRRNPDSTQPPVPFKRMRRCVVTCFTFMPTT